MKKLLLPATIGLAVGGPYLWHTPTAQSYYREVQTWCGATPSAPPGAAPSNSTPWPWSSWFGGSSSNGQANLAPYQSPGDNSTPPLEGAPVADLAEVFRFDLTADEVTRRWARVTTVHAEVPLEGLRVTLVTGTKHDDLAGSLTYYYDVQHRVQRVTFHGTTGDAGRLIELVTRAYNMKAEPTHAAGLYVARGARRAYSALRIEHAALMRADAPYSRLRIELELNNPKGGATLSPDFAQWLAQERGERKL